MKILDEQYKEDMTNRIIKALEKGTAPLQRSWSNNLPINAVTNKYYRGINSMFLSIKGEELSEDGDPRWATQKQAESQGWLIKAGAEPTKIFVLIIHRKKGINKDGKSIDIYKGRPIKKTFEVFHASQIKGIPPFVKI